MGEVHQLKPKQALKLHCVDCGLVEDAACDCGAPYLPPLEMAKKRIAETPKASNRDIASQLGISLDTVNRARDETERFRSVETNTRVGRDGKERVLPQPRKPPNDSSPRLDEDTLSQADADRAIVLMAERLDRGLFLPSPGILAALKEAMPRASVKHRTAIEEAAYTLSELAR